MSGTSVGVAPRIDATNAATSHAAVLKIWTRRPLRKCACFEKFIKIVNRASVTGLKNYKVCKIVKYAWVCAE